MSDLLSVGISGLTAYRAALTAVGDNVANAETPGYSRRTVSLREAGNAGGGGVGMGTSLLFSGATAHSVERIWDDFRAADARVSSGLAGRAQVRQQWLTAVESALGDTGHDVGTLVGKFYNAAVNLSANPGDRLGRASMLSALEEAAGAMRGAADALTKVAAGISRAAQLEVDATNGDLAKLSEVNLALLAAEPGRSSHAALQDQRDRLIDSISARIDVTADIAANGTVTLTLGSDAGTKLLDLNRRSLLVVVPAADGRLSLQLSSGGTIAPLAAGAGTLSGLVDVAASTADKRATLDSLASDFAADLNSWQAAGLNPAGNPGAALLAITGGAAGLRVTTTDPAAIAAASATAENGNLLDLPAMRGVDGAESRWAALVAGQAQALAAARSEANAATTRRDNSLATRDEIIGIDLDREAADLMRYQQAYGAATKIIQTARDTLQSILDLF
ncbi:flagellar hook-associated protein FlgK [Sphingomonas sp. LY54]|uniref:flagellar hook-associated protein FlgK n=1 Tax=Sphingomonas sp. LY54 TaxID=3095343 RepID=UPI002D78CDAD|nr:flagellar hook-associated protein FlgK [Sphingomonas sp. LY54]WRP28294.1 flagellar hook-associated protein FlgK [Sphingomonas sp. LY54]